MKTPRSFLLSLLCAVSIHALNAAENAADRMFAEYFRAETERVAAQTFAGIKTLRDWTDHRDQYRAELFEMMGLSPMPAKTDLKATITGRVDHEEFFVERLHYQSMPGLYVTGDLYVPKNLSGKKVPAILYVCGHANVKEHGVSYGAKASYQHHGAWFARNGYVCLIIDTIELGELEGTHHGTYRQGMWWWNARGYTPGGVEAWNGIRALDYLQSRPEVDPDKLGVTGRSGGGAYSWSIAALDERIKVAVPVAGMTDLHNYVIDGCVAGHCDCMFVVNTYRWDYAKLAALIAPRPLLIGNSDKDAIFPLSGVLRVHQAVKSIYELYNATDKLGLLITEGPHKDTQDLQVPALRWFNRFLKGEDPLVRIAAEKLFQPEQLRVFPPGSLPADQRTTKIHETFVPLAAPKIPTSAAEWQQQRAAWMQALREKSFRGWPAAGEPLQLTPAGTENRGELQMTRWEFTSQGPVRLPLVVASRAGAETRAMKTVYLEVADERMWADLAADATQRDEVRRGEVAVVYLAPRGIGPTLPSANEKEQVQIRRRYMLLGQTIDGMRVWDIRRAVEALHAPELFGAKPLHLAGARDQAVNALYASLFIDGLASVELIAPPASHMAGPDYLNVLRFLDVPQAVAMAAERQPVKFTQAQRDDWVWTTKTAQQLGWNDAQLRW